jgi:hypothetical protein
MGSLLDPEDIRKLSYTPIISTINNTPNIAPTNQPKHITSIQETKYRYVTLVKFRSSSDPRIMRYLTHKDGTDDDAATSVTTYCTKTACED